MGVTYTTEVIGNGNHASIEIPNEILMELGANKRAPLKVTINGHTYQSTATGVAGKCRVVFPQANRLAANAKAGDTVEVHLELDSGYREVDIPLELAHALDSHGLRQSFDGLTYSKRKEHARKVTEAKGVETKERRVQTVLDSLTEKR